jgi:hypothetical protein
MSSSSSSEESATTSKVDIDVKSKDGTVEGSIKGTLKLTSTAKLDASTIAISKPVSVTLASSDAANNVFFDGALEIGPSTVVNPPGPPSPSPSPPPPMNNIGPDGVMQIYPTIQGGTEFYLGDTPDKQKFNISFGTGSHIAYSKKTEKSLTYFNTSGSKISYHSNSKPGRSTRIDTYPDGGMWSNKTKNNWAQKPDFLYTEKGIRNSEFTSFIRTHGDLGTHQAYAHKIAGRDEDAIRSLIEMVYPTATHSTIQVNYNFSHFPYVNAKPHIVFNPPKLTAEKWVGVKTIRKIAADKQSSTLEMWVDVDPFDVDGKPKNNWKLAATFIDKGTKEYKNIPATWRSHKDLIRVDGFQSVDIALVSNREIDINTLPKIQQEDHRLAFITAMGATAETQDHRVLDNDPIASVAEVAQEEEQPEDIEEIKEE